MVRKAHTKSRRGCMSCKKRHVKCDELKPRCSHCTRLEIECHYADTRSSSNITSYGNSPLSDPVASPSTPGFSTNADGTPSLPIPELKLLHFWLLNTSLTCSAKSHVAIYQSVVVELGFQHPYLLHGIFAVAALHRATITTDSAERKRLIHQSTAHYDTAISAYRRLIETPDPATCVPVFLLSGLLHMHILGFSQVAPPVDAIDEICTWIRVIRGVGSSINPNWERLRTSEVAPVINAVAGRERVDRSQDSEILPLKDLANEVADQESRDVYLKAIDELHAILLSVRLESHSDDRWTIPMTLSWAVVIPSQYLDLLTAHEPVALVILSHYAVLFEYQRRSWWIHNWSKWTQEAVHQYLDESLWKWTEWPRSQVEHGIR
ncbi:hypothetical protein AC578_3753 [Pseudocercospora eumusae]|uniref:Zn(2)-C6 fungal-type domain-containing protein n=1 Tax=Pseudocercospora eumusae TaxID=321146 RepID=A0A139HAM8_9PEZI|nr:hypothetical protein AC578_3753 [Pseudocercospora eumusae]